MLIKILISELKKKKRITKTVIINIYQHPTKLWKSRKLGIRGTR